ncbi:MULTISPECIES: hypothetical protein [unclassified Marinitoga]|uniref:hypothetical protein n=1 Tax=unclassified Marinitoga TaxID=2640159 RepID=UPI00064132A3|nr:MULTISPECIES: hypothetical protein [unclassified Marinitoga]KLO21449.1 hypothetical protein X274_10710 [Marinitoga sp. 1155]NUV00494.1 hypothetical protein [Marinitoga sp. 1154]
MKKKNILVSIVLMIFISVFADYNILIPGANEFVKTIKVENYKLKYLYLKEFEEYLNIDNLKIGREGSIITFDNTIKRNFYIANLNNLNKWKAFEIENLPIPSYISDFPFTINNNSIIVFYNNYEKKEKIELKIFNYMISDKKLNLIKTYLNLSSPNLYNTNLSNNFLVYVLENKNTSNVELHILDIKSQKDILIKNVIGNPKLDINTKGDVIFTEGIYIEYYNSKDKTIKEIEFDKLYPEIIMDEPYFVTFLNEKDIAIYSNEKLVIFDIEKWSIKEVIYDIPENIVGLTGLSDGSILINIYDYKGE